MHSGSEEDEQPLAQVSRASLLKHLIILDSYKVVFFCLKIRAVFYFHLLCIR